MPSSPRLHGDGRRARAGDASARRRAVSFGEVRELLERPALRPQAVEDLVGAVARLAPSFERAAPSFGACRARSACHAGLRPVDVALVGAVDAVHGEAERSWYSSSAARRCRPRRTASRCATPRAAHRVEPAIASARPRPRALRARVDADHEDLAERGIVARAASWIFSQLKPASPSASNARRNSDGIEPRLGHRGARSVSSIQPPCSAWFANARLLTRATRPRRGRARTSRTVDARRPLGGVRRAGAGRASRTGRGRAAKPGGASSGVVVVGRAEHPAARRGRRRASATCATAASSSAPAIAASRAPARARGRRPVSRRERCRSRATCAYATSSSRKPDGVGAGLLEVAPDRVAERGVPVRPLRPRRRSVRTRSRTIGEAARAAPRRRSGSVTGRGYPSAHGPSPRCEGARRRRSSRRLRELYPDVRCALDHRNAYELLVATILSAQMHRRARQHGDAGAVREVPDARRPRRTPIRPSVEELIQSTGFFRSKTKSLIGMAQAVEERFGGEVPTELDDLVTLPGVGRKTGNVVRSVWFDLPGPARRHARHPALAPAEAHERDRPGEDRARPRRASSPPEEWGDALAAPDRARPPGVRRPRARAATSASLAGICPSAGKVGAPPRTQARPTRAG